MEDGHPLAAILILIALIAVNGILASAEIALVGLSESKLRRKADEGDKKSALLLRMKQSPSDFLSTIQIGITLAGLLSGAFAADTLAKPIVRWAEGLGASGSALSIINTAAVVLITLLITYLMLVFGELVPKRVAMANPDRTARRFISPINGLAKVTKPLVRLLAASTNGILRLIGVNPGQQREAVTEEEILLMLREGREQGSIEDSEVEFVTNIFEFTDLRASDAMTHRTRIQAIPMGSSVRDVVRLMSKTGNSRFPVYSGSLDEITGVVYSQDIVALVSDIPRENNLTVDELMRKPFFVPESKPLVELFSEMKKGQDKIAVVVDEYGGTSGVVTIMDIIEELVGDIEEEDHGDYGKTDYGYVLSGDMDMEEVAALLGVDMPSGGERDTLSGFITDRLGFVPSDGGHGIEFGGWYLSAKQMKGAFIQSVDVRKQ